MAAETTFSGSIDESARRRFEAAWSAGKPEPIEPFLPAADHLAYLATLEELIHIELEFLWRGATDASGAASTLGPTPRVDNYLTRFPRLDQPAIVQRLLQQEYRLRHRYGDKPAEAEYIARFPGFVAPPLPVMPSRKPAAHELPKIAGYEVLGLLGRGGMGVVYQARQVSLDRIVALKMVLAGAEADAEELARFRTEAEAVAKLHHPNIVHIYEVDEHEGRPYFSLEFIDGGSLAKKLAGTPQPALQAAQLVETLGRAMHIVHQAGIVHRDLKPANILLTGDDLGDADPTLTKRLTLGVPKITDFGLAKRVEGGSDLTRSGAVMGTPSYMAPEQASGKTHDIGPPADIYALGAILYEMLTGRPPFRGETPFDTVLQVIQQDPVPPSRLQPRTPRDLETICLKCLHKEAPKRYKTANELADDLQRFREGEPIRARPVPRWKRAWKWARRRPAQALLLSVGVVLLVGSLSYLVVRHNRRQARQAEVLEKLTAGQAAFDAKNWQGVRQNLSAALAIVDLDSALDEFREPAKRLLTATDQYQQFFKLREDALYHRTFGVGLDRSAKLEASRPATQAALALFGVTKDRNLDWTDSPFAEPRRAEIAAGCYELLLVLAEAEDEANRPHEAVALLDRAAGLGIATQVQHLRRKDYLTKLGDAAGAAKEDALATAMVSAAAIDFFLLGEEKFRRRELEEAARNFSLAVLRQPDDFGAHYFLAVCNWQLHTPNLAKARPDQVHYLNLAKAHLDTCLVLRPDSWVVYFLRGVALGHLGDLDAAEADFRQFLRLTTDPQMRYNMHVNRAVVRMKHKKYDDAVADLRQAIALFPGRLETHSNLATAYWKQAQGDWRHDVGRLMALVGDPRQVFMFFVGAQRKDDMYRLAEEEMTQAVKLAPNLPGLRVNRAQLRKERHDLVGALDDWNRVVELGPSPEDHHQRSLLLFHMGKLDESLKSCDAALKAKSNFAEAHRLRAETLQGLNRPKDVIDAVQRYLKAETGKPAPDAYRMRARARAALGLFGEAVADYTLAIGDAPTSDLYTRRGLAYLFADALQLALADFAEALRLDPENGDAYNGRGTAQVKLGRHVEAVADAEESLQRTPKAPEMTYNAACIYALAVAKSEGTTAQRYRERALELIRQALTLVPRDRQSTFWRTHVERDPDLAAIRQTPGFAVLRAEFQSEK